MSQKNGIEAPDEAVVIAQVASAHGGDSIGDSVKEIASRKDSSVDAAAAAAASQREKSVSHAEVVHSSAPGEKMVSAKEGTVTQATNLNYGNVSANNVASTKYVDDLSS